MLLILVFDTELLYILVCFTTLSQLLYGKPKQASYVDGCEGLESYLVGC